MATDISGQTMTALTNRYYRPRETAGPRPASRRGTQSRDNVNSAGGSRVGCCKQRSKVHDGEPMDAASYRRSLLSIILTWASGEKRAVMALSIGKRSGPMSEDARARFEIPKKMRNGHVHRRSW